MSSASEFDVRLEIGHVLLVDIVGYSKLLITEQRERLQALNEIVRNAVPCVGRARYVGADSHRRRDGAHLSRYGRGASAMCS